MATRVSVNFDFTTTPSNTGAASAHSGGWSEGYWKRGTVDSTDPTIQPLLDRRANLLPTGASIIGARFEIFTLAGNKLLPVGTSGFRKVQPGGFNDTMNTPQDALMLSGRSSSSPNNNRFSLRCLPDSVVISGEYAAPFVFRGRLGSFTNGLVNDTWSFPGRDLTFVPQRVLNVTASVNNIFTVQTQAQIGAMIGSDFMRLLRVKADNGQPIKGSFLIIGLVTATNTYTLQGSQPLTRTTPSGLARVDRIAMFDYASVNPQRVVVRKVGRPFEQYRGRNSKRKAA